MQIFSKLTILQPVRQVFINNYYKPIKNTTVMKELIEKINAEIAVFQANAEAQLVKGNKAAGARARKVSLELAKDLKEFRRISVEETK